MEIELYISIFRIQIAVSYTHIHSIGDEGVEWKLSANLLIVDESNDPKLQV